MTRTQRARLKEIDDLLTRYGLALQYILQERAEIDPISTKEFIAGFAKTLGPVLPTQKKK